MNANDVSVYQVYVQNLFEPHSVLWYSFLLSLFQIWRLQGKEYTEFWERVVAVNGAYEMTAEENMVDYFR